MFQPNIFKCLVILPEVRHSKPNYTLTVDTSEDFERTLSIITSDNLLDLDQILEICNKNDIKNLIYENKGIVKFPANLNIYFETYRREMNMRVEMSKTHKVEAGEYLKIKNNV